LDIDYIVDTNPTLDRFDRIPVPTQEDSRDKAKCG
jgi:hypothetical protein